MKLFSSVTLKIILALLAIIALWLLWGLAKKLFWIGLFVVAAYFVFKLVRAARRR
nr:hypothetical protein [Neorhizobium tomejilense]